MTEPPSTGQPPEDRVPDAEDTPPAPRGAFGLTTFALEGRRAPALFVVGWIGALAGVALITMATLGATGVGALALSVAGFGALAIGTILLAGSQTIERKAVGASYAGPSPLLIFVAVIATGRFAGYVVGIPLLQVADAIPPALGDLLGTVVLAVVFLGVLRLTVIGPGVFTWREMGFKPGLGEMLGLAGGAAFALPVIVVTSVVAVVAVQLTGVTPPSPLPPTGTSTGLVLHLLAGAVLAPIYEEALFRGFALTAWRRTVGPRAAIVRSSLLFVVAHVLFVGGDSFQEAVSLAIVGGVVRVPVAFVLGWLYVRTGSLWAPIGLHAAFNAVLITLAEIAVPR